MTIKVFWDVSLHFWVAVPGVSKARGAFIIKGQEIPEDEGGTFLRNFGEALTRHSVISQRTCGLKSVAKKSNQLP